MTKDKQSLSQEAVRDEAISIAYGEQAREFFHDGLSADLHEICKDKAEAYAMGYRDACLEIGDKLKALKREPNAAGQAGQSVITTPSHEGHAAGPASAAPDVVRFRWGPNGMVADPKGGYIWIDAPGASDEAISRDCNATALERNELRSALSLAQTEIKGHMRVVDELKAELKLGPHITGAAPAYTGEGVSMLEVSSTASVESVVAPRKGRAAIYERAFQLERELVQAQARIAILEEELERLKNEPA